MKKKNIVKIILLIIVIIAIATFFIVKNLREKAKNYEIIDIANKDYQYFVYKQDEKFGIIDKTGKVIIQANYTNVVIPNPTKAVFICYEDKNTKVLNENNENIYSNYENIEPLTLKNVSSNLIYEKTVLKYQKDGKYGLINIDGKKITNAQYEEIDTLQYKEGELLIKQNGKYGVININGYEIIKPEYDKVEADGYYSTENEYKNDGYIVSNTTEEGYRYGYINKEGQKILDIKYNDLKRLSYKNENEAYILCAENGKYGLYKNNQEIISNDYQAITYVDGDEICVVQKGKKYGVITLQGSMILQVKYSQIDVTGDYIYVTDENLEQRVYDKKGNETEINPNVVISTVNTEKNYKIYIDSTSGKTVYNIYEGENKLTTTDYNYIKYLYDDYFIVSNQEGKLGVIDKSGNVKIEMKYDSLQKVNDSKIIQAIDSTTKTTNIYSKDMVKVYEITDGTIENINDTTIKVYNNTDMAYFDLNGNIKESKEVYPNNNLLAKKENGKWGFVDTNGNVVVDYLYDEVTELNDYGYAGIKKDGKWGVIDKNGNKIVDNIYEINAQSKMNFIGEYYAIMNGNRESYYTK